MSIRKVLQTKNSEKIQLSELLGRRFKVILKLTNLVNKYYEILNHLTYDTNELTSHLIWIILILILRFWFWDKISILFDSLKKLKYKDIEAEFYERKKPFKEETLTSNNEFDGVIKRIESLEEKFDTTNKQIIESDNQDEIVIKNRILDALKNGTNRWRSISKLAVLSGTSEEKVIDILRNDVNIVFSKGKSGRIIVRLKNR